MSVNKIAASWLRKVIQTPFKWGTNIAIIQPSVIVTPVYCYKRISDWQLRHKRPIDIAEKIE